VQEMRHVRDSEDEQRQKLLLSKGYEYHIPAISHTTASISMDDLYKHSDHTI